MRRSGKLSVWLLGVALVGIATSSQVFSFIDPTIDSTVNWVITLPTDGSHVSGPCAAMGTGPVNDVAMFGQFTQENSDSTGIFDYELTLVGASIVWSGNAGLWSETGAATIGPSFITISPVTHGVVLDDGPPGSIPDPFEPVDVGNVVFSAGGDSVSYFGVAAPTTP